MFRKMIMVLMLAGIVFGGVSTQTSRMALGQGDGSDATFTFNFSIVDTSDLV